MIVSLLKIDFYLPSSQSLKEKRSILSGIKRRLKNNLNLSVAEFDYHDLWQRSQIGIAYISKDQPSAQKQASQIEEKILERFEGQITDINHEILI